MPCSDGHTCDEEGQEISLEHDHSEIQVINLAIPSFIHFLSIKPFGIRLPFVKPFFMG